MDLDSTAGFLQLTGIVIETATADEVLLTCRVTPELHQPHGLVHGGMYCALVETAASLGGAAWWGDRGDVVGVSNFTNFFRAVRTGELHARAAPVHRGRTAQVWTVEIRDENGRLISQGEVRLANLESAQGLASG